MPSLALDSVDVSKGFGTQIKSELMTSRSPLLTQLWESANSQQIVICEHTQSLVLGWDVSCILCSDLLWSQVHKIDDTRSWYSPDCVDMGCVYGHDVDYSLKRFGSVQYL